MKIAVSYDNGNIGEHFGHASNFAIYDYDTSLETAYDVLYSVKKTIVDTGALHGHSDMVKLMTENGVAAVICGNMGESAYNMLIASDIAPFMGYEGDADTAADLLITGRLPMPGHDGSCGCHGGCGGGCGGGCSDEEGGCCGGCH